MKSPKNEAADFRMVIKGGTTDRHVGDFRRGKQPAQFKVIMLSVHIVVNGKFGDEIGEDVRRQMSGWRRQAGGPGGVESEGEDDFSGAYKLFWVLHWQIPTGTCR